MNKNFKIGFLGGGLDSVVGYTHFVAAQMDRRFTVESGVFSREPEVNDATAEYWRITRKYGSIDAFIDNEKDKLDAIAVLLPTPDHFEAVRTLADLNIPIISEKPLFSSLDDVKKIQSHKAIHQKFLAVTYNYIAYPILSELRKMVLSGELGEIINVHLEMPQESFMNPPKAVDYPAGWRKKDGKIPSILLDLLSHLFSLSYFVTGKRITRVFSQFSKFSGYNVVDDAKIVADYHDGAKGFLWVSKTALGNRNGLKLAVYGKKASAVWIQADPENLCLNRKGGARYVLDRGSDLDVSKNKLYNRMMPGHPSGFIEAFANLYFEIANALDDFYADRDYKTRPLVWTLEKEKENFEFMDAVVRSAGEGIAVEVN